MEKQHITDNASIAIIGSGFSGLCLGINLKQAGFNNFVIFEKADRLGGTWRENVYPGAECDIPSALYSFSFEANPSWSRKWSGQAEILSYMEHCAEKYLLKPHFRFNERCEKLEYDESAQKWKVSTTSGTQSFDFVASGVGQLHKKQFPSIAGRENFKGVSFHSADWKHDVDLTNKTVNVIGNAASAVQFVPQIAPKVKQLNIFQRSANWVTPKNDRNYFAIEKWLGKTFPILGKIYRFYIWFMADYLLYQIMNTDGSKFIRKKSEADCLDFMKEHINDKELIAKLTPDYPIGAKRVLFSDDFYPALARANVSIVTEKLDSISETGIQTQNAHYDGDVIIYATGFDTTHFLSPMQVIGKQGLSLNELWEREGAEAYLGITHKGFPNFFMMYGPNTNLGHNSIILMIEAQCRYILQCIKTLQQKSCQSIEVKAEVQDNYNQNLQERMKNKVWAKVEHSWYKTNGKVTNNWVGRTAEYRKVTEQLNENDYIFY